LPTYNGLAMNKKDDLKLVADGGKPIPIEVWRDGVSSRRDLEKDSGAASGNAASPPKSTGIRLHDHPRFWAACALVGDPD
jgi:hypothetical protein